MKQLDIGDNFIRISKYGGYITGVVKDIWERKLSNLDYGVLISDLQLVSTNGVIYNYNECQKIIKYYNSEEKIKLKFLMDKLKNCDKNHFSVIEEIQIKNKINKI